MGKEQCRRCGRWAVSLWQLYATIDGRRVSLGKFGKRCAERVVYDRHANGRATYADPDTATPITPPDQRP